MPYLSVTPCRCCNNDLEAKYQPHWNPEKLGSILLTCKNQDCALANQTFDERDYATVNLNKYVMSRVQQYRVGQGTSC